VRPFPVAVDTVIAVNQHFDSPELFFE
jgi:hypothetical protein